MDDDRESIASGREVILPLGANSAIMYRFSQVALRQLCDAGWTPERTIDISAYERKVNELGLELFPCVREFLTRFGNLEFMRTRRVVKAPGWSPFGISVFPATYSETTEELFNTRLVNPEPEYLEETQYFEARIDRTLHRVGRLNFDPYGSDVFLDTDGQLYISGEDLLAPLGASIYDGIEAVLTDRPNIETWTGDRKDWRKKGKAEEWLEYVNRTAIVPPDEVIALLIPEAQEAIRDAAYQQRRAALEEFRASVKAAMSVLKVGRPRYANLPLEGWLTIVRQGLNEIRQDIDTFQSRQPIATAEEQASVRTCAFVCAVALFAYGDFGAAKDIVDNVHSTPTPAMRRLAYVVPLLIPPITRIDPLHSSDELLKWLASQRADWVWNEELASYESARSGTDG